MPEFGMPRPDAEAVLGAVHPGWEVVLQRPWRGGNQMTHYRGVANAAFGFVAWVTLNLRRERRVAACTLRLSCQRPPPGPEPVYPGRLVLIDAADAVAVLARPPADLLGEAYTEHWAYALTGWVRAAAASDRRVRGTRE